jgi:hypothetical protein
MELVGKVKVAKVEMGGHSASWSRLRIYKLCVSRSRPDVVTRFR